MSKTPNFYLVDEGGDVTWTDSGEVAEAAGKDGSTLVIDTRKAEATFDSATAPIGEADRDDYIEDDVDSELPDEEGTDE